MKQLPVGVSNLRMIREWDMVYVDKTDHVHRLAQMPGRYFLSRPRRFGKSLLVDTLKELFEANEPLFRGLAIHDRWDWGKRYPVIKIDWASGVMADREQLRRKTIHLLHENADALGVSMTWDDDPSTLLENLIKGVVEASCAPAVLLVDEYDKPLLDNIENPGLATVMRDGLKEVYSAIKKVDSLLHFVFLTGVSKFSKVNIFSGINNLSDITLSPRAATLCGYTEGELDRYFAEHMEGVDRDKLREWYNGYNFLGDRVYNPFDVLLFLSNEGAYRNYWFETGTPTFLIKLLKQHRYFLPELDGLEAGESLLGSFEVEAIEPATLLFQAGYLTIGEVTHRRELPVYTLVFPNSEVRVSFNEHLVSSFTGLTVERERYADGLWISLTAGDLLGLEDTIRRMFSSIAWENYRNNDIAEFEGYYASVLYAFFAAVNCRVIPEDVTNHGQVDLTVMIGDFVYVIEIKVVGKPTAVGDEGAGSQGSSPERPAEPESGSTTGAESEEEPTPNEALAQIRKRGYAEKYLGTDATVFEIGIVFSRSTRNVVRFDYGPPANRPPAAGRRIAANSQSATSRSVRRVA